MGKGGSRGVGIWGNRVGMRGGMTWRIAGGRVAGGGSNLGRGNCLPLIRRGVEVNIY